MKNVRYGVLIYVISSILSIATYIISVSGMWQTERVNRITHWSMCKNRRKYMLINPQTISICIRLIVRCGKNVGNFLNLRWRLFVELPCLFE